MGGGDADTIGSFRKRKISKSACSGEIYFKKSVGVQQMGFDPGDFFKSKELQSYDVLGKVLFSRNDSGCNIRKQVTWSDDWFDLASFKQSFSFFFYYFFFFFF